MHKQNACQRDKSVSRRFLVKYRLFLIRSSYRASTVASTAVDASISVDLSLISVHRNSTNRAAVYASAASDAIVIDLISHSDNLLDILWHDLYSCPLL